MNLSNAENTSTVCQVQGSKVSCFQWALTMNFPDNEAAFWGNVKQQRVKDQIATVVT